MAKRALAGLILFCASVAQAAITAPSYLVTDMEGNVLLERNADDVRSIASLTKLVVSKYAKDQDQDEQLTVTAEDVKNGHMRTTPLKVGRSYTRRGLLELALVSSDNVAALTLGRHLPEGTDIPVTEWSGLNPGNQLTARQLADLARSLYNTDVAAMSVLPNVKVDDKLRHSTNPLIEAKGWSFYLSKTGFINASGGCLTVITEMAGKLVTVVILGSKDTHVRWKDLVEIRRQLGDADFAEPIFRVARAIKGKKRKK